MKLKIKLEIIYPDTTGTENNPYRTRNMADCYEQEKEIAESEQEERTEAVIKAFNNFRP